MQLSTNGRDSDLFYFCSNSLTSASAAEVQKRTDLPLNFSLLEMTPPFVRAA